MAPLNNSTQLTLSEIVVQLFNDKLLSDVKFLFIDNNKVIYAHSFLLMSRSIVYETEFLENQGTQKLIPVQKYDFGSFYEFIRFIYTDKCTISNENMTTLLELSVKYKIPKLENNVLAYITNQKLPLIEQFKIFEYCESDNYQLLRGWALKNLGPIIMDIINSEYFLTIHENVLESILKMEFIGTASKPVKETDLFYAVINWMDNYCKTNDLALSERRMKFDNLIRLIRFSNMTFGEAIEALNKSNCLFTDSEYLAFLKSKPGELWDCTARKVCTIGTQPTLKKRNTRCYDHYPTSARHRFQITGKLIICGLRYLTDGQDFKSIQLKLINTKKSSTLLNVPIEQSSSFEGIISFGDSFILQPQTKYQIEIEISNGIKRYQYADIEESISGTSIVVHSEFIDYYNELERDPSLVEIFFKKPV